MLNGDCEPWQTGQRLRLLVTSSKTGRLAAPGRQGDRCAYVCSVLVLARQVYLPTPPRVGSANGLHGVEVRTGRTSRGSDNRGCRHKQRHVRYLVWQRNDRPGVCPAWQQALADAQNMPPDHGGGMAHARRVIPAATDPSTGVVDTKALAAAVAQPVPGQIFARLNRYLAGARGAESGRGAACRCRGS
jgi:hypothetical protein